MKLVFIRHGDPDYGPDTLTEKGWREAALLNERVKKMDIKRCYVSPLGRAQDTAKTALKDTGIKPNGVFDWLREFWPYIERPDRPGQRSIAWDWLPEDWTTYDGAYDPERWTEHPAFEATDVKEQYEYVCREFDKLVAELGYERNGNMYKVEKPNNDTIVFFCHFGIICVMLSRLIHVSPMVLWHNMAAAPTSVTVAVSEERREGKASFRITEFGDVSHLYAGGEEPSFSCRFCECYMNEDERHD